MAERLNDLNKDALKRLQFRKGLETNVPELLVGEPGYSTDSRKLHIGNHDGTNATFIDEDAVLDLLAPKATIEALENHVTLNQETHTNFNLVEREVVQDGLIKTYIYPPKKNNTGIIFTKNNVYHINLIVSYKDVISGYILGNDNNAAQTGTILYINNNRLTLNRVSASKNEISSTHFIVDIIFDKGNVECYVNGRLEMQGEMKLNSSALTLNGSNINFQTGDSTLSIPICNIYNRALSPQEIAHNLQVLSQNPNIDRITTTDLNNNKKEFVFATDSNHVVMQNGYNAEECANGLLATMGQEFVAENGEIVIDNAIEKSKLLGVEIHGQTVKNIQSIEIEKDIILNRDTNRTITLRNYASLKPNTQYTLFYHILDGESVSAMLLDETNMSINVVLRKNTNKITFTTTEETTGNLMIYLYISESSESGTTATLSKQIPVFEGELSDTDLLKCNIGLNSTEATLSVNDTKYSFYEPTIEGKTEVIDGELVSLEASIDGLPVLGEWDYIDRATKKMYSNSENILEFQPTWYKSSSSYNNIYLLNANALSDGMIMANNMESYTYDYLYKHSIEGVSINNNGHIAIGFGKDTNSTLEQFEQWLQNNHTIIRYQLAEPITRQLTTEEFNAYDHHKKVICLDGIDDVRDRLIQNKDGNVTVERKYSRYVFTGNESITLDTTYPPTDTNYLRFRITTPLNIVANPKGNSNISEWVDAISTLTNSFAFGGAVSSSSLIHCVIEKSKLSTQDSSGMANWLKNNNIEIIVQTHLNVAYISHRTTPTIPLSQQQINICSFSAVQPLSLSVTIPTSDNIKRKTQLTLLNNWEGELVCYELNTGEVQLVGYIDAPAIQGATDICYLPSTVLMPHQVVFDGYNAVTFDNQPFVIHSDRRLKFEGTFTADASYAINKTVRI